MAIEDYIAEATTEVEEAKPVMKVEVDGTDVTESELTDDEYTQMINDLASHKNYVALEKYKDDRARTYPSIHEFMEAYTEKEIGEDSTKWDAYVTQYNPVRTDNPKG